MDLTERHDLHSGDPHWDDAIAPPPADPLPQESVDVAIVGAGVMGAMVGAALADQGARVAFVDRRAPATGSTAASTALVMWEMDVPLTHLAARIGADEAGARWRRVHQAVTRLRDRIEREGVECGAQPRPVAHRELIFQRHRQPDPNHIGLGEIDLVADFVFLDGAEIAVTAADDLKTGIGFAQDLRGARIGFLGGAQQEETQALRRRDL